MKSGIVKIFIIVMIGLSVMFNVYLLQAKNSRYMISYNTLLKTTKMINSLAFGEGFLEDPFKGENLGEFQYEKRLELQYYEYEYDDLNNSIGGEKMYKGYKTAITEIVCIGRGSVACYTGVYPGFTEDLGEVKESDRKDK